MSVHIEIGYPGRWVVVEAAGTSENIAAELAAAASMIYAQLGATETSAGADFRAALTAMLRKDAAIWDSAKTTIKGGYGRCIVYAPPQPGETKNGESDN